MSEPTAEALTAQLRDRVAKELADGHTYEALQFVQSFIARKKKFMTPSLTSTLVFTSVTLLMEHNACEDGAALLVWYIETGANAECRFQVSYGTNRDFCDLDKLLELYSVIPPLAASHIVNKISGPFGKVISAVDISATSKEAQKKLNANILKVEEYNCAAYEASSSWLNALKCAFHLGDMQKAGRILDQWAKQGYKYEYPLFFARAVFHLLAEGHTEHAMDLVGIVRQRPYIVEAEFMDPASSASSASASATAGEPTPALASWHLATIMAELATLTTVARNTKYTVYHVLCERYVPMLTQIDSKLPLLLQNVGKAMFATTESSGSSSSGGRGRGAPAGMGNMMEMLQNVMGGGGPGGGGAPGAFDLQAMMGAMQGGGMQQQGRPGAGRGAGRGGV